MVTLKTEGSMIYCVKAVFTAWNQLIYSKENTEKTTRNYDLLFHSCGTIICIYISFTHYIPKQ